MPDLTDIDDTLANLGGSRPDTSELVVRYGERDRTLARIDDALRALGAGVTPVTASDSRTDVRAVAESAMRPASQPAAAPASRHRKNLLDEAFDPNEFPQTVPPPAPGAAGPAATREDSTEEGFELLVDDEDIIEIDEDNDPDGNDTDEQR